MTKFTLACIQFTDTTNINQNLASLVENINSAYTQGAEIIFLPEICNIVQMDKKDLQASLEGSDNSTFLVTLQGLAKSLNIWIHIGSMAYKTDRTNLVNRAFMINSNGDIVDTYDKIHMFDVNLKDGENYQESASFQAGNKAVISKTPFGNIGLSICYDVRFASLYTSLALQGAGIMAVPACFTYTTGIAHWEILCRCRAIETGSFVVATGQTGNHQDGRRTYGHSMVINPWGKIVACLNAIEAVLLCTIDTDEINQARNAIGNLKNIKDFS